MVNKKPYSLLKYRYIIIKNSRDCDLFCKTHRLALALQTTKDRTTINIGGQQNKLPIECNNQNDFLDSIKSVLQNGLCMELERCFADSIPRTKVLETVAERINDIFIISTNDTRDVCISINSTDSNFDNHVAGFKNTEDVHHFLDDIRRKLLSF